ncbi:glycosyltransferase [Acuticoccus sp. M5D2P5]|uniref:glycosyltransferase n=1 Tax=Acuticoccus kalidii TaxID=2910977 RepID=UPI001F17F6B4|nr:glycosyltransferase [Acuticoccus kalidii]
MRRELRKEFDDAFYLRTYPKVRKLKIGPLRHYILVGWKEGKDPSELFSTRAYLDMYHDVAAQGMNPFHHFVAYGREEGRIATVSTARRRNLHRPTEPLRVPVLPSVAAWAAAPRRVVDPETAPAVNVVIPVYKSLEHVAATIYSVLTAECEVPFECLVIDDCSPEPEVSALLAKLAASGHIRLIVNETNQGFVRTVNIGMAHNTHRDVVLLNADTVVHEGWLDRLMRPLRDHPDIATVTPLSNNATLASYPNTAVDNAFELECDSAMLDRLAFKANGTTVVDVPTGVGFAMAIRRASLDELGLFDAETFGLGYGEECDFCMRAIKAGWRNVLATGVYVRHFGSMSFGPSQLARSEKAQELLATKHPDYAGRIARHIAADPVLPSRILLDIARLREMMGPVSVLFFSHTRGGGIETYLENTAKALIENNMRDVARRSIVVQTQVQGFVKIGPFGRKPLPYLPNLEALNLERHKDLLAPFIELLDPELVHMNSFAGLSVPSISRLMEALISSGRPYWHIWHDHQPLCPRLTFLDAEDRYCGETDSTRCSSCLAATSTSFEWVRIADWRERFRTYLAHAELVSAPSEAAALRARRLADVAKVEVHPHAEPHLTDVTPITRAQHADGKRHILILGAIGPHKGAYLIHSMLQDIERRNLPLHLDIVGYTALKEIATGPNCTLYGKYHGDADAIARIQAIQPDVSLFASIWPETYLFTMSVTMALHLPTVAFDLGAQSERLREYARGAVLPERLMEDPVALNDALLALDLDALWEAKADIAFPNDSTLSDYFRAKAALQAPETAPAEATTPPSPHVKTAVHPASGNGSQSAGPIPLPL